MFNLLIVLGLAFATDSAAAPAASGPFELSVSGAGSRGTLVFAAGGVSFEAADPEKSGRWSYRDLKQIRVISARRIALDTFEDGSRWRFGADRTIEFDVTGDPVDGGLVAFLIEHVERPVASAVLPAGLGEPRARVPVKHVRGRTGTHGTMAVYASGLAYESAAAGDSRYWRFTDIESILRLSSFRLLIDVYERGRVRPFAFELKTPMPADVFDDVWNAVNGPTARARGGR